MAADRPDLKNIVLAALASLVAHELSHMLEYEKGGLDYERKVSEVMVKNFRFPFVAKSFTAYCSPFHPDLLIDGLHNGVLASFLPQTAISALQEIFHHKEFDSGLMGFYIALRAGFDPNHFGDVYLDDLPGELTHPPEAEQKRRLQVLAQAAQDAGLVTLFATPSRMETPLTR